MAHRAHHSAMRVAQAGGWLSDAGAHMEARNKLAKELGIANAPSNY